MNLLHSPHLQRRESPGACASRRYCYELTRRHAKNFFFAFWLLPRTQRYAMYALYSFLRYTDDIADGPGDSITKKRTLAQWRNALDDTIAGKCTHLIHPALRQTIIQYRIPPSYLHAVLDGVEMDLDSVSYKTFAELYTYCWRVAAAVGLACIHIWGFRGDQALAYAESAGIAFQLTNILRDLGEDLDLGRVYLPYEELQKFQALPQSWREGWRDNNFQKLMSFQIQRARLYYDASKPLLRYLSDSGRAVFSLMSHTYESLLDLIEARNYDVFSHRVRLSSWQKLRLLLSALPVRWGIR